MTQRQIKIQSHKISIPESPASLAPTSFFSQEIFLCPCCKNPVPKNRASATLRYCQENKLCRSNTTYHQLVVVKGPDQPEQTYKVLADRYAADSERNMIWSAFEKIGTHHTYLDGLQENSVQAAVTIDTLNISLHEPNSRNVWKSIQMWKNKRTKYENWHVDRARQGVSKSRVSDSFNDGSDDKIMNDVSET